MGTSSASLSKSDFVEKVVTICGMELCYNSKVKKCNQRTAWAKGIAQAVFYTWKGGDSLVQEMFRTVKYEKILKEMNTWLQSFANFKWSTRQQYWVVMKIGHFSEKKIKGTSIIMMHLLHYTVRVIVKTQKVL
jgi:hypothetical protein